MIFCFVVMLIAISCSNEEQERGQFQGRNQNMLKMMEEELYLTQGQVDSIRIILDENQKQMQAMREKFGGDREAMREAMGGSMRDSMRVFREKMNQKIMEVLDEDQKKDYEKLMEERRNMMRQRRSREE